MKVVGLTGGIATGKSTVSKRLLKKGYQVIDADAITHNLQIPGSIALEEIRQVFDGTVLNSDGSLNRQQLSQMVFSDEKARKKLNDIMHPKVLLEIKGQLALSSEPIVFLDVPLLFEVGLDQLTDVDVVVYAPIDVQLERLMTRDKIGIGAAQARIDSQMPIDEKVRKADFMINNQGSLEDLEISLAKVLEKIVGGERSGEHKTNN